VFCFDKLNVSFVWLLPLSLQLAANATRVRSWPRAWRGGAAVSAFADPVQVERLRSSEEKLWFTFGKDWYAKFYHLKMGGGNGQKSAKVICIGAHHSLAVPHADFFSLQAREKAQAKMESAGGDSL
jgi:hypothetical protein